MYIHLHRLRGIWTLQKGTIYANCSLFVGRAPGVRSFNSQAASNACWSRSRESRSGWLRPPRTRISESRKQRGAAARSTVAVSAYGGVFEREPSRRGCRVFLGAIEGIRTSPDGRSKGAVSERHRIVASSARILSFLAVPNRLRQRNDCYPGTSQAAFRRASLRGELDCRHRPCSTAQLLPSAEGGARGTGLVPGER